MDFGLPHLANEPWHILVIMRKRADPAFKAKVALEGSRESLLKDEQMRKLLVGG